MEDYRGEKAYVGLGSRAGQIGAVASAPFYPPKNEVCASRTTETQNILESNGKNIQHLSELTARVRTLRDRLMGSRPEAGQEKPTPSGSGVLTMLANQSGDTSKILETLSGIVSDLEGV